MGTLKKWSAIYGWQKRAEEYDAELENRKNERAEEIMQSGLALDHERVAKLKKLADFLEEELYEKGEDGIYHNVWIPDVKQIGSGPTAEKVDIERFNAPIIGEYRSTLDDLAKETGGRKAKIDLTTKGDKLGSIPDDQRLATNLAIYERARARADDANLGQDGALDSPDEGTD